MTETLYEALQTSAALAPDNEFLHVPSGASYAPDGVSLSYREALRRVKILIEHYKSAGYGIGSRVALLLENRPDYFLHLLALNARGASVVPVNPDYRHNELLYQMQHSEATLVVCLAAYVERMRAVASELKDSLKVVAAESFPAGLPVAPSTRQPEKPDRMSEAAVFYTSGTTGRPKGCVVTNDYWLSVGDWFKALAQSGGRFTLRPGQERLFNPMPAFHIHAGVVAFMPMLISQGCLIRPERFQPQRWWQDVAASRATILHYIGVVPQALLNQPAVVEETTHCVDWGFGAGMEPSLHAKFEQRFGFPHVEVWGMTEVGRWTADQIEPRQIGTRAIGRPFGDLQIAVVDGDDHAVPAETEGEMVLRYAGPDPRRGFFSGYLKDTAATEAAWRSGWFHTGDVVRQNKDGMVVFVDRKKNIIRRSGENIAAAEIEALFYGHPAVAHVAILAAPDETRGEEVLACIVPNAGFEPDAALATRLFDYCYERLAFFKAPGWIIFFDALPLTPTQKVSKSLIFAAGEDPRSRRPIFDLRARKRRPA